ncbi:threonine/serine exporter family protein [Neobacillus sp. PS3-34]|uniref:threonine/serine exporter family protein n=1 Tax=Neobacillus sp. PS3-34 TaxID=3070678 RepID=UPI0027E210E4|nr:threonine/serine exporter family protein [Neobacillus sp. PS3-34]WML49925.1 threonine/serine exporter family protein [Neobacillus sp. PS3-34]
MNIIEQLITSFIATGAFGVIFNAPKQSLIKCGLVGMVGWLIYVVMVNNQADTVLATLAAAFFVAVISHVLAKIYKTPVIIFSVAGIIPLVPGGLAYDAMRNFVENDYGSALTLAAKAFMLSGSIAFGLVFSEVINQIIRKIQLQQKVKG